MYACIRFNAATALLIRACLAVGSGAGRADCAVKAAAAASGFVTAAAAAAVVSGFCGDFTPFANEMDECFRFNEVDVVFNVGEAEHP